MNDGYIHITGRCRFQSHVECGFHDVIKALVTDDTGQLQGDNTSVQERGGVQAGGGLREHREG